MQSDFASAIGNQPPPTNHQNFQPDYPVIDPRYEGLWIPLWLLKAEDITRVERDLVATIIALSKNEKQVCYASNKYLAEALKVAEGRLANILVAVKKKGFVKQIRWDGKHRHLQVENPINGNRE